MNGTTIEDLHFDAWESSMNESDEESRNVHRLLLDYYTNDEVAKDVEGPGELDLRSATL